MHFVKVSNVNVVSTEVFKLVWTITCYSAMS